MNGRIFVPWRLVDAGNLTWMSDPNNKIGVDLHASLLLRRLKFPPLPERFPLLLAL